MGQSPVNTAAMKWNTYDGKTTSEIVAKSLNIVGQKNSSLSEIQHSG
jgi:hypothetical protein